MMSHRGKLTGVRASEGDERGRGRDLTLPELVAGDGSSDAREQDEEGAW